MQLKRIITLDYPTDLLPPDLQAEAGAGRIANIKVQEERETYGLGPDDPVDWMTIARRWVAGKVIPISEAEVPADLFET